MIYRSACRWLALCWLAACTSPASAVLLYSTAQRNTDPPGSLANRPAWNGPLDGGDPRQLLDSGWQWQGSFSGFLGTAIAPQYFITAKHIGGSVGSIFSYQGTNYTTINSWASPNSDLRIWQVNQTFSDWAPLYDANVDGSEVNKSLVVIGRGSQRGEEVRVGGVLKGWKWGADDRIQAWGENVVSAIYDGSSQGLGDLLGFDFNAGAGPNEAALSIGDSGGGLFIQSGGVWKLAGINYGVEGPWRINPGDTPFQAAIFDASGLYLGNNSSPETSGSGTSYATRISFNLAWIQSVIGPISPAPAMIPEPGATTLLLAILAARTLKRPPHVTATT